MSTRAIAVRRRRKIMAIVAGGLALSVASVVTLAAWNNNEWVFGGTGPNGDEDGVGTSSFNVQQNAWSGTTAPTTTSTFVDEEENPGNALIFNVDPTGLTPDTTIYAPVAMKTTTASIAGELQLRKPVPATGKTAVDAADATADIAAGALWGALTYSVAVTTSATTAANCTAGDLAAAGTVIAKDLAFGDAVPVGAQQLSAAGADIQYYCFAITLPDNADTQKLQNRVVFPAWQFVATSD